MAEKQEKDTVPVAMIGLIIEIGRRVLNVILGLGDDAPRECIEMEVLGKKVEICVSLTDVRIPKDPA